MNNPSAENHACDGVTVQTNLQVAHIRRFLKCIRDVNSNKKMRECKSARREKAIDERDRSFLNNNDRCPNMSWKRTSIATRMTFSTAIAPIKGQSKAQPAIQLDWRIETCAAQAGESEDAQIHQGMRTRE
jgi:hypothetical protein